MVKFFYLFVKVCPHVIVHLAAEIHAQLNMVPEGTEDEPRGSD